MSQQVSIRLPDDVLSKLEERARRKQQKRSELIREALEVFLEYPDGTFALTPYERVRKFIGVAEIFPSDLATNSKKYLGTFGKRR